MTDIKVSQRARKRAFNKALKKPSSAFTVVSRKKSQGTSQKKVSVTHQMIYPITLEKRHFIDLRICMADFAGMLILKNERRQVKILRIHVEWHWEGEVLKHFQNDRHWMHSFLLNQVSSNHTSVCCESPQTRHTIHLPMLEQSAHGLDHSRRTPHPWQPFGKSAKT